MSKHTDGPWAFRVQANDSIDFFAGTSLLCCGVRLRNKADASLIAAGPDLLAALEEFVEGLDEDCGEPQCGECLPYRKARRAIAKARGE